MGVAEVSGHGAVSDAKTDFKRFFSNYTTFATLTVSAPESGLKRDSVILLNQIRTIDKRWLIERWGSLTPKTMQRLDEALKINLGLGILWVDKRGLMACVARLA